MFVNYPELCISSLNFGFVPLFCPEKLTSESNNWFVTKLFVQTGIFDPPVIVLQANWELYTSDRGEIRVHQYIGLNTPKDTVLS